MTSLPMACAHHGLVSEGRSFRRRPIVLALLLLLIAQVVLYNPVLDQGFVLDDYCWLTIASRASDAPASIFTLFISGFFRPLVHLVFLGNYIVSGLQPWGYNAINILLEIGCVFVFAWLAFRLSRNPWAAFVGACLFATHPCHGEAVGWISARTTSLLALMALLTLVFWFKWRETDRRLWCVLAFVTFCLALLSKEEAAVLLPVLVGMDVLLCGSAQSALRESIAGLWRRKWVFILFSLALLAYLLLQYHFQSRNFLVRRGDYALDLRALVHYVDRFPALFVSRRSARPPWLQVVFCLEAVVAIAVLRNGGRELRRLAVFGIMLSICTLLPAMFFRTHHAARYNYIPSIGSALVWTALVGSVLRRAGPSRFLKTLLAVVVAASMLTQVHHLQRRLGFWEKQGRFGKTLLRAAQEAAPLLREAARSGRRVCLLDAPVDVIQLQCLFRLVGGLEARQVRVLQAGAAPPESAAAGAILLRWDASACRFVLVDNAGTPRTARRAQIPALRQTGRQPVEFVLGPCDDCP